MKRLMISSAVALAVVAGGAPALAHGPGDRWEAQREWERDRAKAEREWRKDMRKAQQKRQKAIRKAEREQAQAWRRGQHMPRDYYAYDRYGVNDPYRYGLRPAPAGYRWVLVEDNAYMVRNDNGLIAELVMGILGGL